MWQLRKKSNLMFVKDNLYSAIYVKTFDSRGNNYEIKLFQNMSARQTQITSTVYEQVLQRRKNATAPL